MNEKSIVYIDWNILISLKDKRFSEEKNNKFIKNDLILLPFSSSHIQEADNIENENSQIRDKLIKEHLDFLNMLSKNFYIYFDNNKLIFMEQNCEDVLETIKIGNFDYKSLMKAGINILSEPIKELSRNYFGIEPEKLNNISPEEVVVFLNEKISSLIPMSILELIDNSFKLMTSNPNFILPSKFGALFEIIDMLGYWKDKEGKNFSRAWDFMHAFYASICDFFISDDKRTRNKTKVLYYEYKIKTKVLSSDEFLNSF